MAVYTTHNTQHYHDAAPHGDFTTTSHHLRACVSSLTFLSAVSLLLDSTHRSRSGALSSGFPSQAFATILDRELIRTHLYPPTLPALPSHHTAF